MERIFRIHPAIGAARIGNAPRDAFFVGPELPGIPANFDPAADKFRTFKQNGLIKPQAARFHVWEYTRDAEGVLHPKGEVKLGEDGVEAIEWEVHVANRKAEFFAFEGSRGEHDDFATNELRNADVKENREAFLVIDPGPKRITGRSTPPVPLTNLSEATRAAIPDLGELRTDDEGRLLVIGGAGNTLQTGSKEINDYVNNDGWFDDVGDGPVSARVILQGTDGPVAVEAADAWVIVGPPDFAPAFGNVVSLYDTLWDLAVRELPDLPPLAAFAAGAALERLRHQREDWKRTGTSFTDYEPSFVDEVAPIIERAFLATFVYAPPAGASFHTTLDPVMWQDLRDDEKTRRYVFDMLRNPDATVQNVRQMPKGLGDGYLDESDAEGPGDPRLRRPNRFFSLTRYQYALLRQWMLGKFRRDGDGPRKAEVKPLTPEGLDRAALDNCVGGPFFPGIEVSWLVRKPEIYREPFRLKRGARVGPVEVGPGFLTQQMALPWQADFRDCHRETFHDPETGEVWSAMWWAAQRPDDVYPEADPSAQVPWTRPPHFTAGDRTRASYEEMRTNWFKLGFVAKLVDDRTWVETERE